MSVKEVLDRLAERYGSFKVAYQYGNNDDSFWVHKDYPSEMACGLAEQDVITDRHVMKDEIVVETDMAREPMNRSVVKRMGYILRKQFNFKTYSSGNKSYHLHMVFPELKRIESPDDLMLLKRLFVRWMYACPKNHWNCTSCSMMIKGEDGKEFKCALIKHRVDMQLMGKHMIRIEGAEHPKTGRRKIVWEECNDHPYNRLPQEVWDKFNAIKAKSSEKKLTIPLQGNNYMINKPCMMILLNQELPDGHSRAAFAVYNNLRHAYGPEKAKEMLFAWNEKVYKGKIRKGRIDSVIRSGDKNDRAPGCAFIKTLLRDVNVRCPCEKNTDVEDKLPSGSVPPSEEELGEHSDEE
jgi:hypothetical protein